MGTTTTVWKQISDTEWQGTKGREDYTIVKRPIGRGRSTFHCYKKQQYIANGMNIDDAKANVERWIKAHS